MIITKIIQFEELVHPFSVYLATLSGNGHNSITQASKRSSLSLSHALSPLKS